MYKLYIYCREEGPRQVVLFPEGTNLTEAARDKSRQFAEKNNLPLYSHVLHPRTAGEARIQPPTLLTRPPSSHCR